MTNEKKLAIIGEFIELHSYTGLRLETISEANKTSEWNDKFLLVDWSQDKKLLNLWLKVNYRNELKEATDKICPDDDAQYFDAWLDYLTDEQWGYTDEYQVCDHCQKVFRHTDSICSHGWIPREGGVIYCEECVETDSDLREEYISERINNPDNANTILASDILRDMGFERVNSHHYENGWYGRRDNPKQIYEEHHNLHPDKQYLFSITNKGNPFSTEFNLWERD